MIFAHQPSPSSRTGQRDAPKVHAVVLTYRRPRLATGVVSQLVMDEGIEPGHVHLVINGEGGLEDAALQDRIRTVTLPRNEGASGGFRSALTLARDAAEADGTDWVYVCEDDVGLFNLPTPRVADLIARVEAYEVGSGKPVGAVVVYGRDMLWRTGNTRRHVPRVRDGFEEVDSGAWAATLLSTRVLRAGLLPDPRYFWGCSDLEYFLRIGAAGFRVVVDVRANTAVAGQVKGIGSIWREERPERRDEPWCAYYYARNFFEIRRRHGNLLWSLRHFTKCVRRFQLAPSPEHRRAIAIGWLDGVCGRMGKNPSFVRVVGEY